MSDKAWFLVPRRSTHAATAPVKARTLTERIERYHAKTPRLTRVRTSTHHWFELIRRKKS